MTKILKTKQEKDERRTSNAQHRTSKVDVASLHFFNKIETPKAYPNSTLEVRCSMLDVRLLARFWSLDIGICDLFVIWCLFFVFLDTKFQGKNIYLWLGPDYQVSNIIIMGD